MLSSLDHHCSASAAPQPALADHESMLRMLTGFCVTQILQAVAQFCIADKLAQGPATAGELAARCALNPEATHRLLPLTARLLNLKGRLLIEAGDYISSVPSADLHLLKYVLRNWDDATDMGLAALMDLSMLVVAGGRERTVPEYAALYEAAGLCRDKITFTPSNVAVMEVLPKQL